MLTTVADGVWITTHPVSFLGLRLTANMTVLRLADGSLLLHSPVAMSPELRDAVAALGDVAHLYAPNSYHHMWIGDWKAAFPAARLHAAAALRKKRRDLAIDRVLGSDGEPAFAGVVDELHIDGFRLDETVLLHRPSRSLVVADLVHNIGPQTHGWTRTYTRMMGFHDRVAMSGAIRWLGFSDRAAARRSLEAVLALPFERILVGHGTPVGGDARAQLAAAHAALLA